MSSYGRINGRQIWNEPSAKQNIETVSCRILDTYDNTTPVQIKVVKLCKHHCLEAQVSQFSLSICADYITSTIHDFFLPVIGPFAGDIKI